MAILNLSHSEYTSICRIIHLYIQVQGKEGQNPYVNNFHVYWFRHMENGNVQWASLLFIAALVAYRCLVFSSFLMPAHSTLCLCSTSPGPLFVTMPFEYRYILYSHRTIFRAIRVLWSVIYVYISAPVLHIFECCVQIDTLHTTTPSETCTTAPHWANRIHSHGGTISSNNSIIMHNKETSTRI